MFEASVEEFRDLQGMCQGTARAGGKKPVLIHGQTMKKWDGTRMRRFGKDEPKVYPKAPARILVKPVRRPHPNFIVASEWAVIE
jgi:hypothetical protein